MENKISYVSYTNCILPLPFLNPSISQSVENDKSWYTWACSHFGISKIHFEQTFYVANKLHAIVKNTKKTLQNPLWRQKVYYYANEMTGYISWCEKLGIDLKFVSSLRMTLTCQVAKKENAWILAACSLVFIINEIPNGIEDTTPHAVLTWKGSIILSFEFCEQMAK